MSHCRNEPQATPPQHAGALSAAALARHGAARQLAAAADAGLVLPGGELLHGGALFGSGGARGAGGAARLPLPLAWRGLPALLRGTLRAPGHLHLRRTGIGAVALAAG